MDKDNDPDWDGITSLQTTLESEKNGVVEDLSRSKSREERVEA
jgi:hypothetical protein